MRFYIIYPGKKNIIKTNERTKKYKTKMLEQKKNKICDMEPNIKTIKYVMKYYITRKYRMCPLLHAID